MKLLNTGATNAKILKSQTGTQFKIASLSLYPNNTICAGAKAAGCMDLCLKDSGFSEVFKSVNIARKKKTDFYMQDPKEFLQQLRKEIAAFIRKCERESVKACFRLNTISDINWIHHEIPQEFSSAFFYDYTKIVKTLNTGVDNYRKIFSYSGEPKYQAQVDQALKTDFPIAVVFRDKIPVGESFLGREIINGDKSDLVNTRSFNKICGLTLKGKENKKQTGMFIVEPWQIVSPRQCAGSIPVNCMQQDLATAGRSQKAFA